MSKKLITVTVAGYASAVESSRKAEQSFYERRASLLPTTFHRNTRRRAFAGSTLALTCGLRSLVSLRDACSDLDEHSSLAGYHDTLTATKVRGRIQLQQGGA